MTADPKTDPTGGAQYFRLQRETTADMGRWHGADRHHRAAQFLQGTGQFLRGTGQMSHSPLLINSQDLDEDDIPRNRRAMSNTRKTPWARAPGPQTR